MAGKLPVLYVQGACRAILQIARSVHSARVFTPRKEPNTNFITYGDRIGEYNLFSCLNNTTFSQYLFASVQIGRYEDRRGHIKSSAKILNVMWISFT